MARGDSRFERPAGRVMAVGNPAVRTPPLPAFGAHAPEAHDWEDLENLHLSEKNRALDCRLAR
jgi:hypothetical protein